ncbi:MAG TPA: fatty acyl-AMP ligase, partial [Polyangium sp.]|nr:fatty acyl-AMP ligase [Polyangium sp.]
MPFPPNPLALDKTLPRLQAIIADAKPAVIMTTTELLDMARMLLPDAASAIWLATDGLSLEPNEMGNERRIRPEDIAFLQYTSGSTADPKGVMVSHGNLIENSEQIYQCFGHCEQSQGVIWLPPYHDMGLIGGILQPLYGAFPVTLMSPLHFLQKPLRWLQAITRYQATTSGGPNFAYELCIRKTSAAERAKLELHAWELAFNGAEPIRPETLERFSATFGPCGFKRSYFYPCYGLAEATLIVSGGDRHAEPITETFDARHLLAHQVAHVEASSPDARKFVACGVALGQTVRIVDPETRRPTPPGRIGEIWVAGPSVAQGYWRNDEQTERVFRALTDSGEGPYLRTGDLGFVHNGELFIAGRCKDLIIVRGRNYYPQDIEQVVETSHPGLRPGCGAAFAIDRAGEEQLVVVHEVEPAYENKTEEVVAAIRRAVVQGFDIDPHAVVLVKSRKIPKTSSGKIQRHACRTGFVAGDLDVVSSWQAPVTAAARQKPVTFASGDEASMQRRIATWIAAQGKRLPLDTQRKETGRALLTNAARVQARIQAGLDALDDPYVFAAFRLANRAIATAIR